jgi:hypothetical protein
MMRNTLPPLASNEGACHSKRIVRKMAIAASRSFRLSEMTDIPSLWEGLGEGRSYESITKKGSRVG